MSPFGQIFAAACAMVAYFVVTWVALVITVLLGAGFELTLPSFPWWATIFWWTDLLVFVWYVAFRLAPRYFVKTL